MRLRFKNSKILAVLVTALFLCSLFPGYGFAEESGDPSQPIVTEYQLPGQENPDGITDGNPQDNPEGTEGDDPQSPGGNPEGTEGDDPQNNPGENPEGTEGADPQDNPGDDPEGTEGADPQDNPGENPEGTPGNNLLAGIPDVSVLVLKHVVQTLDGQTIEKVVEIPDVALGSVIAGIDYSVQDLPEGLIFTGSIPEFLAIQAGDNQIILNYQELPLPEGQVPEEIKESPGQLGEDEMEPYFSDVWLDFSPVSNNKTQQSMRMAAPSNRAFSLSTLSSQPLAPGEVKASKDAEWHDYDNRIAWIKLSVQGQPVAIGADVVLVVDNSGSMAGSDGKVRDCSGQLINPVKTGTDSWSTGIFGSKQWESETYQGVCSECGKTVEYTITRSRVWAFGWGSWSDWSTPNTNHSIYRIDIAKQAAASFVGTVLGDDNPNGNQVALVPFSSSDYGNHLNGVGFQDSVAGLTDSINAMYAEGGTNYTQALALAKTYIDGRSDQDRPAYVVFVSDGAPGKSGNSPNDPNWNGIYQANQLKNAGVTIYSVGIALSQSNAQALTALATVENGSPLYQNVQNINDLSSVLTKIAGSIKNAGTEALLTDEINTEYFDLLSGTAEYPLPAGVTVESGGIVQWNIGAITADLKEIVLYVKLKDAYANVGNLYDTNSDVYLSYTNADGEDAQKTKQEIGDPNVVVEAVVYTVTFQAGANGSLTGTTSYPNILEGTTWATAVPTVPTPVPDAGYSFTGWTPYFPATVTENATYTANFAEDADVTINYEAATGGSVSLASEDVAPATGTAEGSTATAAAGYSFVNWTDEDDNVVGTDAEFTPAKNSAGVYEAATYTANFAEDADVTINYAATTGGSVSLASETLAPATGVAQGSTATAATGYHFVNWTKDGVEVNTDATFVPAKVSGLNVAATYTANFAEDADVTINYAATTGGSVSLASETLAPATGVAQGSTATAATGYHFVNWTKDGVEVNTDATFVPAKVSGLNVAATYTANFAEDADVTINYAATTGGSVSLTSEDVAPATGTAQGSTATAAAGYSFVNWTDEDDNVVGTDAEFTPAKNSAGVYEAATYTANFAEDADVTINYAAATGGSVSLASETLAPATGVAQGSTATAAAGYHFVNWTKDGVEVSTDATFVPAKVSGLNVAATYIANFVPVYNVIYHANGGTGYPSDDTNYHEGEWVDVISGVNRESYAFAGWNTQADGSGDHYMQWGGFYMPAHNVNLYAQWTQAVDDQYRTAKNTLLEVAAPGVLSNDGYVPFEYLSVGKLTDTEHGTLSFNPDGSFTYEPENGFVGTDSFFYEISAMQPMVYSLEGDNGDNGMEEEWDNPDDPLIAKVTITVYGNAPVAANDSYNTNRNATLTIAAPGILANDSDAEGDSLAAVLVNSTSNGTLTLNADGSFTYVPNSNYVGTDSFTYKANDGIDDSNTATVTINVRRPSGGGGGGGGGTTTEEIVVEPEATLVPLNTEDHFAYMAGYPDNTLRPEGKVTREEVAAVFFRLLDDTYRATVKTDVNNFSDVATDRWSNTQISTLAAVGIITGYPDGTFRPGNTITRAELATIASKFDELSPFEANNFSDIAGHWANQYINSASQKGWVSGYEDGTFKPEQAITRAEFMTLVNNVLGRKVLEENILPEAKQFPDLSSDAWYYEAAQEAINSHYYERENPTDYEVWTELYDTNIDL